MDLAEMTGPETIEWLVHTFPESLNPSAAGSKVPDVRLMPHFPRVGITSTDLITVYLRNGGKTIARVPEGERLAEDAEEIENYLHVGPEAWFGDPENRSDWVAVAGALSMHESMMQESRLGRRSGRRKPDGGARYGVTPREIIAEIYATGRGPAYAHKIIATAVAHQIEVDAYGFEISPATYADLAAAGVEDRHALSGYTKAGLTLAEAIQYRSDGIAAAAVLMAAREGYPRDQWHEVLLGLPTDWFVPLNDPSFGTDRDNDEIPRFLRAGGNDRYTIADLRYLVEHGWSKEGVGLGVRGMSVPDNEIGATARRVADHGLTWEDMDRWAGALAQGKEPQYSSDTVRPPLLRGSSHARGYGTNSIYLRDLDRVFLMTDRGIKSSHVGLYKKCGAKSPEDAASLFDKGLTPPVIRDLLQRYGRKPSRWQNTLVFDSIDEAIKAYERSVSDGEKPAGASTRH